MQNIKGETVELYIPRKCSRTNRLLTASDCGSVQINIADIDPVSGVYKKSYQTVAFSGFIRAQAESDEALYEAVIEKGL